MNHYLVAFSVVDPRREEALVAELRRSRSWLRSPFPGLWMVCTPERIEVLQDRCGQHLVLDDDEGDLIWIRYQRRGDAQDGWLPRWAWEWLNTHLA